MKGVELYAQVRYAVQIEGLRRREAARRYGIDLRTVAKMLAFSVPPGYRRSRPPARPKLDPFTGIIDQILLEDEGRSRKQRHTSKRIFQRLFATRTVTLAGSPLLSTTCCRGGCGIARSSCRCGTILAMRRWILVRRWRRSAGSRARSTSWRWTCRTATPVSCRPIRRRPPKRSATGTTLRSTSSARCRARSCMTTPRWAVARILGDGVRQRTRVFSELQSHYVFADRFGRPGKGNDKGKVEGLVGWIRRNLLVAVARAASLTALNEQLLEGCRRRLGDRLRGHEETIGERLVRDLAAFHSLPPVPYDAWEKKAGPGKSR